MKAEGHFIIQNSTEEPHKDILSGIMQTQHTDTHRHGVNVTEEPNLFPPPSVAGAAFSPSQLREADIKTALGETIYTQT